MEICVAIFISDERIAALDNSLLKQAVHSVDNDQAESLDKKNPVITDTFSVVFGHGLQS